MSALNDLMGRILGTNWKTTVTAWAMAFSGLATVILLAFQEGRWAIAAGALSALAKILNGLVAADAPNSTAEPQRTQRPESGTSGRVVFPLVFLCGLCASAVLLLATGCATNAAPALDMNKVAEMFYRQQETRVYKAFEITGVNRIEGSNMTITVQTHMEPMSLIPRDPGFLEALIPTAGNVLQFGLGAWAANTAFKELGRAPKTVEQPAPMIVRPEIVTVPAP